MKDFLTYLVSQIVDHPEAVAVEEAENDQEITNLSITVDPQDIGKVIGKSGRIIKALRDLTRILAVKKGLRVNVLLREE